MGEISAATSIRRWTGQEIRETVAAETRLGSAAMGSNGTVLPREEELLSRLWEGDVLSYVDVLSFSFRFKACHRSKSMLCPRECLAVAANELCSLAGSCCVGRVPNTFHA